MSIFTQIFVGSVILGLCSMLHIILLAYSVRALKSFDVAIIPSARTVRWILLAFAGFAVVVFAHTLQVWIWAFAFVWFEALPNITDAIYFSLTTYTTLGYGDVVVGPGHRVFAAMGAVTGLLSFGLSTAFLVELISRLLPVFK